MGENGKEMEKVRRKAKIMGSIYQPINEMTMQRSKQHNNASFEKKRKIYAGELRGCHLYKNYIELSQ